MFLEWIQQKDISVFSNGWSIELLMMFYRVWHAVPFAFVIFYAALQTVEKEKIEAAIRMTITLLTTKSALRKS